MAGEQGSGSGNGIGASPLQLDPATVQMFQAFTLYMQQQQAVDHKEAMATKALHSVVGLLDQFDGRNISRYLKFYSREMELNKVPEKEMISTFKLAVVPELRCRVVVRLPCENNVCIYLIHIILDNMVKAI